MKNFYFTERKRQQELIKKSPSLFYEDEGDGEFRNIIYPFVLKNGENNLYSDICGDALKYFTKNGIAWWGGKKPTGHILSSQIACLNHLFLIKHDRQVVLDLVNNAQDIVHFQEVLKIECDEDPGYIAFEVVSDGNYLNEGKSSRGTNCTSIDALVLARDYNGVTWLIPIEWKYTESYDDSRSCDKSAEVSKNKKTGRVYLRGETRQKRYNSLIEDSSQLKSLPEYSGSIYYYEPFYQLMRQTLWAEAMVKNYYKERIKAEKFLHIHVVPQKNGDLLDKEYRISKMNMEQTWQNMLKDPTLYVLKDTCDFVSPITKKYPHLWHYLKSRYNY